jgi:hypothetical protein
MLGRRLRLAIVLSAVVLSARGRIGSKRGGFVLDGAHVGSGHGMAEFANDQAAHQQKHQCPALPAQFTHGERVPSAVALRNDATADLRHLVRPGCTWVGDYMSALSADRGGT